MQWPRGAELERLAQALAELIGGRQDVAARFYDFQEGDQRVSGWTPWKGRRVKADYQPAPGETVGEFKDYRSGRYYPHLCQPLSTANLVQHLRGRERLGVYVLDHEARAKFLAADFDDHEGQLDPAAVWAEVRRFVDTCTAHEWRAHVERSKSGRGYHVWLFFDAPVDAAKLRAVGRWLMEESEVIHEGEDFGTFDRFFPAQSEAPPAGRGYGNLIGLPLSGETDYCAGRCAWINPANGKVIGDPMRYTLRILEAGRNAAAAVDAFMQEWDLKPQERGDAAREPGESLDIDAVLTGLGVGSRDNQLFKYSARLRAQGVSKEEAWVLVRAAWEKMEQPPGDPFTEEQARQKLESAYRYNEGRSAPKKPEQERGKGRGSRGGKGGKVKAVDETPPDWESRAMPWERPGVTVPLHEETGYPWPPIFAGYTVTPWSVKNGDDIIARRPFWVDAVTLDSAGEYGVVVRFFDQQWRLRRYAMSTGMLHKQGGVMGELLQRMGLVVLPGKEKWCSRYLAEQYSWQSRLIEATGRLGWFRAGSGDMVFVLPEVVIGEAENEIAYQSDVPLSYAHTLRPNGTLKDWQDTIAARCAGNPLLMFSIMVALAGPLLQPCNEQGGGFHFYGTTSGGKTTCGQVAASVWGCGADPGEASALSSVRKWDATINALEGIAELHSDQCLVLDEIGQTELTNVGKVAYKLANGRGKERATANMSNAPARTWRVLFMSNGEVSLKQVAAGEGRTTRGGQLVRLVDIPVDGERGQRDIVVSTDGEDPKLFVEALKRACLEHYGTAGPTFAAYLVAKMRATGESVLAGQFRDELKLIEAQLAEQVGGNLPPEALRVLRRFALVALAGLRAGPGAGCANVVPWSMSEVMQATAEVAKRWARDVGPERSEIERGLAHLRAQLLLNADRFRWTDKSTGAPIRDLLGYRVTNYFLVLPEALVELCGEFNAHMLLVELRERGLLWAAEATRLKRQTPRLEWLGNARPYVHWIRTDFLGAAQVGTTEEDWEAGAPAGEPEPPRQGQLGADEEMPI